MKRRPARRVARPIVRPGAELLPAASVSLAWLAGQLRSIGCTRVFDDLLRALDPARHAALKERTPEICYLALLDILRDRFPVWWGAYDSLYNDEPEGLVSSGIPIEALGVTVENDYGDQLDSPAIAVCVGTSYKGSETSYPYQYFECLNDYADDLIRDDRVTVCDPKRLRPAPGWAFIEPWNGIRDLYLYAWGSTGYSFLDTDMDMIFSGYVVLPRWTLAEIKSLTAQWKRAAPVWRRITALESYVNQSAGVRTGDRVTLLARALTNDRAAWREITYKRQEARRNPATGTAAIVVISKTRRWPIYSQVDPMSKSKTASRNPKSKIRDQKSQIAPDRIPRVRLDWADSVIWLTRFDEQGCPTRQYPVSAESVAACFHPTGASTGLLPPDCLFWQNRKGVARVGVYLPPAVRPLIIATGRRERKIAVPLPGFVFVGEGHGYSLYAVSERPAGDQAQLYLAPLPNVSDEGAICYGNVKIPVCESGTIHAAATLFFESAFNDHLSNGKLLPDPRRRRTAEERTTLNLPFYDGEPEYDADDGNDPEGPFIEEAQEDEPEPLLDFLSALGGRRAFPLDRLVPSHRPGTLGDLLKFDI